jgi:hypothetical protein
MNIRTERKRIFSALIKALSRQNENCTSLKNSLGKVKDTMNNALELKDKEINDLKSSITIAREVKKKMIHILIWCFDYRNYR